MDATDIRTSFDGLGEVEFRSLAQFNDGEVGVFGHRAGHLRGSGIREMRSCCKSSKGRLRSRSSQKRAPLLLS